MSTFIEIREVAIVMFIIVIVFLNFVTIRGQISLKRTLRELFLINDKVNKFLDNEALIRDVTKIVTIRLVNDKLNEVLFIVVKLLELKSVSEMIYVYKSFQKYRKENKLIIKETLVLLNDGISKENEIDLIRNLEKLYSELIKILDGSIKLKKEFL